MSMLMILIHIIKLPSGKVEAICTSTGNVYFLKHKTKQKTQNANLIGFK